MTPFRSYSLHLLRFLPVLYHSLAGDVVDVSSRASALDVIRPNRENLSIITLFAERALSLDPIKRSPTTLDRFHCCHYADS